MLRDPLDALRMPPLALMPASDDQRVLVTALGCLDLGIARVYELAEVGRIVQSSN